MKRLVNFIQAMPIGITFNHRHCFFGAYDIGELTVVVPDVLCVDFNPSQHDQ
jgi:hypothetical protein